MASVREVRTRIKSIKTIQQITRAMKMVSAARFHKAQAQLLEARPYARKLREVIQSIAGHAGAESHPLLARPAVSTAACMVLTSDKGLCGGFNVQALQRVGKKVLQAQPPESIEVLAAGRKSLEFLHRSGVKPYREWAGFWQELKWSHADLMGQDVIEAFSRGRWSSVTLVYNRFKSVISQEVVEETLLPIPPLAEAAAAGDKYGEFAFEPGAGAVYSQLLPRYVKMVLWHALLESKASELAARMTAMQNANESAGEMISELTLQMNRARQAAITREISELVTSAEAVNA